MNLRVFINLLEEYEKTFAKELLDSRNVRLVFTAFDGEAYEATHHMGFNDPDGSTGPHIDFTLRPVLK